MKEFKVGDKIVVTNQLTPFRDCEGVVDYIRDYYCVDNMNYEIYFEGFEFGVPFAAWELKLSTNNN